MTLPATALAATTTVPLARPPVPTLVPEVPAGSLTRGQLNPLSVDNSREILPEHLPIIEAYLTVLQGEYQVISTAPIDPDAPFLATEPVTEESRAPVRSALARRRDLGHVLDVSQGVTFRPYVVGPVTDTAVLYDCELAGHYWVFAETGELVPPDEVWVGGPSRIEEVGVRYNMVYRTVAGSSAIAASTHQPAREGSSSAGETTGGGRSG